MKDLKKTLQILSKLNEFYSNNNSIILPIDLDNENIKQEIKDHLFEELLKYLKKVLDEKEILKIKDIKDKITDKFSLENGRRVGGFSEIEYNIYKEGFNKIIATILEIL